MTWQLAIGNLATVAKDTRPICRRCNCRFTRTSVYAQKQTYCCSTCKDADMKDAKQRRRLNHERKPLEQCGPVQKKIRERAEYFRNILRSGT